MLLVADFGQYKTRKMTETLANGYSSESTQRELPNEYQHDRVKMIFINFCFFVHWKKVALALEGLKCPPAGLDYAFTYPSDYSHVEFTRPQGSTFPGAYAPRFCCMPLDSLD